MILQRYLDDFEVSIGNRAPTFTIEYRGRVENDALLDAYKMLCLRYPVLRGRVRPDSRRHLLYVAVEEDDPDFRTLDGDEHVLVTESCMPWDFERSLARLMHVRSGNGGGLIGLQVDHAVVDARHLFAIFGDLMKIYTDTVEGTDASGNMAATSLPLAPYELLTRRLGAVPSVTSAPVSTAGHIPDAYEATEERIRLTADETIRIRNAARSAQTSVHALVSASILVAQRQVAAEVVGSAVMMCQSLVDLRQRVTPPVAATEVTNFIAFHRAMVAVDVDSSPALVGRDIKKRLDEGLSRNELSVNFLQNLLPWEDTALEPRLASASITNPGIIDTFESPRGLSVTDFRIPPRPKVSMIFPSYIVYSYSGQLNLKCVFPTPYFSGKEIETLVGEITTSLQRVGRHASV